MLARARRELEVCHPGDHVLFSVFVFEPGDTSEKLIAELAAAARRGVRITLRTDTSAFSWFTRFCEGTTTLIDRLQDLSQSMPEHVAFEPPDFPTHVKLLLFRRRGQADVAIFGGINVGDRFRSWRDFSVVVSGDRGVDALLESLDWPRPQRGPGEALGLRRLQFVTNKPDAWDWPAWLLRRPFAGVFDLGARMERFFADEGLVRYRVVASYIDDSGLELLACALSRGASVQLVLPRMPNVYKDCNARTLGLLVSRWKGCGLLTLKLHEEMVHAKAAVAEGGGGPRNRAGYIGSCNLKRRSFSQFEELNAFTEDQVFCGSLWHELGVLLEEAEEVFSHRELPFSPVTAVLEDYFG